MSILRKSARGESCTLRLPGCRNDTETTVLCHIRIGGNGGIGLKPDDMDAVYGCFHCHEFVDRRTGELTERDRTYYLLRALMRTHRRMVEKGILKVGK